MGKFEERIARGAVLSTPMAEARWLLEWLRASLLNESRPARDEDLPLEDTVRNRLIEHFDFANRRQKS